MTQQPNSIATQLQHSCNTWTHSGVHEPLGIAGTFEHEETWRTNMQLSVYQFMQTAFKSGVPKMVDLPFHRGLWVLDYPKWSNLDEVWYHNGLGNLHQTRWVSTQEAQESRWPRIPGISSCCDPFTSQGQKNYQYQVYLTLKAKVFAFSD